MTHPLLCLYIAFYLKPQILDDFCIYVFHFLLDSIREITEEVDVLTKGVYLLLI